MINSRIANISIIITGFISVLFVFFPELDITFSKLLFTNQDGFIYKQNIIVYQIYKFLPLITKLFVGACAAWLFCSIVITRFNWSEHFVSRSSIIFLLICAIIGPGLIVNVIFKENFGRARPVQITLFNGTKEFTPAFKMADQCDHNCSFASGHAAMAFYFTAIAYISKRRNTHIYLTGLAFGSITGLSRIMMGGHFLSDVITSAFIVLLLNHLIFILWQKIVKTL